MAGDELKGRGWYLTDEGIQQCCQNGRSDVSSITKAALDLDLKEIGAGWLPEEITRGRADYVEGPGVLQLQKIRNVSAPKDNEESQGAPRLMKLVLTDGQVTCTGIEVETLNDISLNTAPGSKLKLKVTTDVEHGFLLLNNKNTQYLGGRVEKMAESWALKKKLAKQPRATAGEGGPPLFVPFGKRISDFRSAPNRRDNFKSLEVTKETKPKTVDGEFEQQRKATIAEVLQAKEDGKTKQFGGQKQIASDHGVAKITEMGFSAEEASTALKFNNGNIQQALDYLLNNKGGSRNFSGVPNRQSSYEKRENDKGRGRRGPRDADDEAPSRGRRGRDNEGDEPSGRPSGPATLFDFLETKMPAKEEKAEKKEPKPAPEPENTSSSSRSSSSSVSQNNSYSHSHGQNQGQNQGQGRPRPSNQHQESWSHGQSGRRQQNIPPRFVNKAKQGAEQSYSQGYNRDDRPRTVPTENRGYNDRRGYNNKSDERTSYQNYNRKHGDYNQNNNNNYSDRRSANSNEYRNYGGRDRQDYQRERSDQPNNYSRQNKFQDRGPGGGGGGGGGGRQPRKYQQNQGLRPDSYTQNSNYQSLENSIEAYQPPTSQSESRSQSSDGGDSYRDESPRQPSYPVRPVDGHMNTAIVTAVPAYQPHNEYIYTCNELPQMALKMGDRVMAKYWEDGLFYEAVIDAVVPGLPTCVVTFVDYGNPEEVLLTDVQPCVQQMVDPRQQRPTMAMPQQPNLSMPPPPQVFYAAPPPQLSPIEDNMAIINSMEFRRGGGGYNRKREDTRPPQQLYQPPPQRR